MSTVTTEIRDTLDGLIETDIDAEKGFIAASRAVNDAELKADLMEMSRKSASAAGELQRQMADLGEEPRRDGSVYGWVHRGWMEAKQSLLGHKAAVVLADCERGLEKTVEVYRNAREEALPENLRAMIQTQCDEMLQMLDRIRALRQMHQAS